MKKLICLAAIITLVTGLCFAKPVYKTAKIFDEEFELSYTNDAKEVAEIVQLFEMVGKELVTYDTFTHVTAPSRLFERRDPNDDIVGKFRCMLEARITFEDYIYCVVRSGNYFTVLKENPLSTSAIRKGTKLISLSALEELNPQVYWLEENDDLGCVFLDCDRLPVDKDLVAGTVEQAIEHGHTHLCPKCQERLDF